MKQVLLDLQSGEISIEDVPVPALKKGVVVENAYSLISAGKSLLEWHGINRPWHTNPSPIWELTVFFLTINKLAKSEHQRYWNVFL